MVSVEHTGHAIESKAIKLVLLHPKAEVAQKEAQYFVVAIVEKATVPKIMATFGALVKVKMVAVIEHIQSVQNILRSMAVHNI